MVLKKRIMKKMICGLLFFSCTLGVMNAVHSAIPENQIPIILPPQMLITTKGTLVRADDQEAIIKEGVLLTASYDPDYVREIYHSYHDEIDELHREAYRNAYHNVYGDRLDKRCRNQLEFKPEKLDNVF